MIVYGGGTTQPADSDVWILNATNYPTLAWERMNIANVSQGPNLRMGKAYHLFIFFSFADHFLYKIGHSSVYDDANKKIYMYGGWGVSATNDSNMYVLDVVNWSWTRVPTTGYPIDIIPTINTTNPGTNVPGNNNSNNNNNNSMSTGSIVGAAVGAAVGLLAIAAIIFFLIRKRRREKESVMGDGFSENIQHHELKQVQQNDNPYYYNAGGYYNTNDDDDEDDDNHPDQGYYTTSTHYNNIANNNSKRTSKAWTGGMSTQTSFARRSEIGDSDHVVTGILEEVNQRDDGTIGATHGSRSPRESFRNSKVLLVTPTTEYVGQGQVPNEIISQKPNQFSIPATRLQQQHLVPVDHHRASMTLSEDGAPLSSSMEVLRSIKTNASSMMNHPGSLMSGIKRSGVPVTHATTVPPSEDDEENWTFADSLSVSPPIQYITPNSHQLSTSTSTQTWDTKDHHLVNHHYPSSTLNMPLAQTVTPPTTANNSSNGNSSNTSELRNGVHIYNSVSPLDALASLGQPQHDEHTPETSRNGSSTLLKNMKDGRETVTTTSSTTTTSSATEEQSFLQLAPLINALPRRYQVDKSKAPITGPTNNILFVTSHDKPIAVKAFGRREAWERECRTLIKLKSPCVVEILEVLTIQNDQHNNQEEEQEGEIKYVTIMERLEETLGTFIRNSKRNNTFVSNGKIARDILGCLSWCHGNGVAFCDLKPSNIMHYQGEPWKLIDFEGSRTINEECVGVITPRYCPPEVARATTYGLEGANGVVATASVDLWSFGCVIYELETKKPLFASNIKDETILHFVSHPSPSTPILNNGLRWNENKELEIPQLERLIPNIRTRQLIKTLLSRDPSKRGSAPQLLVSLYENSGFSLY